MEKSLTLILLLILLVSFLFRFLSWPDPLKVTP